MYISSTPFPPPPLLNCADPFIPTFKPLNISFAGNPDTIDGVFLHNERSK